ncbi:MAG: metalloregulator ArsR/SmtB family transcription factor [Syntrophobacterales bacterium]|nr:metalloregulator ArsR/SmtB family transcription factor [Syntrophobacterales bacterium]
MKNFIRVMKALSEPNRVKILKALAKREMCVCELQALLGLAQPTVSKHLKALEDAELVESFKENLWVNYRLYRDTPNPYARTLIPLLDEWLEDDPTIKNLTSRVNLIDRYEICEKAAFKRKGAVGIVRNREE